jgi:hypothetical protein
MSTRPSIRKFPKGSLGFLARKMQGIEIYHKNRQTLLHLPV